MTFDIDTAEKACEKGHYKEALKIYEKLHSKSVLTPISTSNINKNIHAQGHLKAH